MGRDEHHMGKDEHHMGRDEHHMGRDEHHMGRDEHHMNITWVVWRFEVVKWQINFVIILMHN